MVLPFRPAYGVQEMSLPNSINSYDSWPVIVRLHMMYRNAD
jgi:hypothetical protein